tara:strand:- start:203 stop:607 length:405 start_codon:yes stop_codon:yes gene_type:complete
MKNLLNDIKKHEGFRSEVYKDTLGIDTIGYGFAIKDLVMDQDIAEKILKRKVENLIKRIKQKFPWYSDIPEEAQDVVANMCYQLGVGGFSKFKKTIKYISEKKWDDASIEMLDSLWARQTPNRAIELSNTIKSL